MTRLLAASIALVSLACQSFGGQGEIDKAALRSLVRVPYLPVPITLDIRALRAERAGEKLAALSGQLVSDRTDPRITFRAGSLMREMSDPAAKEYFGRAVDALQKVAESKPLDVDQAQLLVEAATAAGRFEVADKALAAGGFAEDVALVLRGELRIFKVWEAAQLTYVAPGADRYLSVSLAALRNPGTAKEWKQDLAKSAEDFKKACQLEPKEARPHRGLAVALVTAAYIESALLWRSEQKTSVLMPVDAFAHFKEAANLTPEDVVAQWEAYESRVAMEKSKGLKALPSDATKFIETLLARLKATAESDATDSRRAREISAVIQAQIGNSKAALEQLVKAEGDPPIPRVQMMRFQLLLAQGQASEAAPLGEQILQREFVPEVALGVAAAWEIAGQIDRADTVTTDALAREPSNPELRLARVSFLLRDTSGEGLAEAGTSLSGLAQIDDADPLSIEVKFARAIYFGLLGDAEAATLILRQMPKAKRVDQALQALRPKSTAGLGYS